MYYVYSTRVFSAIRVGNIILYLRFTVISEEGFFFQDTYRKRICGEFIVKNSFK